MQREPPSTLGFSTSSTQPAASTMHSRVTFRHPSNTATDFLSSDYSESVSSPMSPFPPTNQQPLVASGAHSASVDLMGQAASQPDLGLGSSKLRRSPYPTKARVLGNAASATGLKLKRAFVGRRKKSEEVANTSYLEGGCQEPGSGGLSLSDGVAEDMVVVNKPAPKGLSLQLASHVFGARKLAKPLPSPPHSAPNPHPQATPRRPTPRIFPTQRPNRSSNLIVSPTISSALDFMLLADEQEANATEPRPHDLGNESGPRLKEVWRKSDSTTSYHTVRASMSSSARLTRPVSMSESLHSTTTIIPVNKRLSAVVTDGEITMAVEDLNSKESVPNLRGKASPASSVKGLNRRSMSLNLGSTIIAKFTAPLTPPASAPPTESKQRFGSRSPGGSPLPTRSSSQDAPTLSKSAARGVFASMNDHQSHTNVRGRLAAISSTSPALERALPPVPPSSQNRRATPPTTAASSLRQAAVSITGFAPAAGLAKRAVEKLGRVWGLGYSSSSSHPSTSSSSYTNETGFGRTDSDNSLAGSLPLSPGKNKSRRTPQAPSGAWSLSSSLAPSNSAPDIESSGPTLGRLVRGRAGQAGLKGLVFGRDLASCVKDTASTHTQLTTLGLFEDDQRAGTLLADLRTRKLPAIVFRCSQHLLIWGIKEEGLFRVSGRPSHVAKIRAEFDAGADYDMSECSPGDLDPHAVASVFKAYLRELPEPILTHALYPLFESAMGAEDATAGQEAQTPSRRVVQGPYLPSGPKSGMTMRKPPSLSTLALPKLAGMRQPSQSLLKALRILISKLPEENRDLIHTVVDFIVLTAKESSETKMPLSNLLLIFCPSLVMNPPLLRVLCENESVWEEDREVLETPKESEIAADSPVTEEAEPPLPTARHRVQDPGPTVYESCFFGTPPSSEIASLREATLRTASASSGNGSGKRSFSLPSPSIESYRGLSVASSGSASSSQLPLGDVSITQSASSSTSRFKISAPVPCDGPVRFPFAGNIITSPLCHQRSLPTISLPSPGGRESALQRKKSSPKVALNKRSASPLPKLRTGSPSHLQSDSDSSLSTPRSTYTTYSSPRATPLPILNLEIDSSSLDLSLDNYYEIQERKRDTIMAQLLDEQASPKRSSVEPISARIPKSYPDLSHTPAVPNQLSEAMRSVEITSDVTSTPYLSVVSDLAEEEWMRAVISAANSVE